MEGAGPPIAFIHGGTGNRAAWRSNGYVDRLKDKYCLILIDARGHFIEQIPNTSFLELVGYNHVNANSNLDAIVPTVLKFLSPIQSA